VRGSRGTLVVQLTRRLGEEKPWKALVAAIDCPEVSETGSEAPQSGRATCGQSRELWWIAPRLREPKTGHREALAFL